MSGVGAKSDAKPEIRVSVLLAGCGDIGTRLGELLAESGEFQVLGARRTSKEDGRFQILSIDLLDPSTFSHLPETIDYIVYTATPSQRTEEAYQNIYVRGLQNLLAHYQSAAMKRVFYVSSTSVYPQQSAEWVDESTVAEPTAFSGSTLLKAENWLKQQNVPSTVIRFAGIYGPGRNWLLRKVSAGCEAVLSPSKYTNRIHVADCAGVLAYLIRQDVAGKTIEPLYIGVDCEPVPEWDVLSWLAAELNVEGPKEIESDGQQNKRCSNARLLAAGYRFIYPSFKEGYREQIDSFVNKIR